MRALHERAQVLQSSTVSRRSRDWRGTGVPAEIESVAAPILHRATAAPPCCRWLCASGPARRSTRARHGVENDSAYGLSASCFRLPLRDEQPVRLPPPFDRGGTVASPRSGLREEVGESRQKESFSLSGTCACGDDDISLLARSRNKSRPPRRYKAGARRNQPSATIAQFRRTSASTATPEPERPVTPVFRPEFNERFTIYAIVPIQQLTAFSSSCGQRGRTVCRVAENMNPGDS